MKIIQLSIFLENRAGCLMAACKTLAENGVNIKTLSLADTEHFGILRILVEDWSKAKDVLEAADFVVKTSEVVALKIKDEPGGLVRILKAMDDQKVNVEYMYAFPSSDHDGTVMVFRFEDPDAAVSCVLEGEGGGSVTPADLFS